MSNVTYLPWVDPETNKATGSPEISGEPVMPETTMSETSVPETTMPETAAALSVDELETMLLKKLHRQDMSRVEVELWLTEREAVEGDAQALIEKCERLGYIDDVRLAQELVARLGDRQHKSKGVIQRELHNRKLDSVAIHEALAELSDDSELGKAIEIAESRARQLSNLEPEVAKRRLLGFLARRGYSGSTAMTAMRTALKL